MMIKHAIIIKTHEVSKLFFENFMGLYSTLLLYKLNFYNINQVSLNLV